MPLYMQSSIRIGPYRFEASQPGAELAGASRGKAAPDAYFIRGGPSGFSLPRLRKGRRAD